MRYPSERAESVTPFLAMDVLARARELERGGRHIIHMEVGDPDLPTASHIVDAAFEACRQGQTHYTPTEGILELREAIAEDYRNRQGVDVNPDNVVVSMGTSPGLLLALGALLDPGDEVIVSNPTYACYGNAVRFLGGNVKEFPIGEQDGFTYDPRQVEKLITPRTKALIVNSPANPTGITQPTEVIASLAHLPIPYVLSDEIYHGVEYGKGRATSILCHTDRAFVLNGFSKRYCMTGWRLGYLIVPSAFVPAIKRIHQNYFLSTNAFVQWAGVAALRGPQDSVQHMVETYEARRRFVLKRLHQLELGVRVEPTGAFYVLANASRLDTRSVRLAMNILEEAGVAVTPGIDFGSGAEGFLRFSYTTGMSALETGMDRLERYVMNHMN